MLFDASTKHGAFIVGYTIERDTVKNVMWIVAELYDTF